MFKLSGTPRNAGNGLGIILSYCVLAYVFGLVGCVTHKIENKTISIDSDPSGVHVEVNGEDLGKTPTTYTVQPDDTGHFAGAWEDTPTIVFVAFPPEGAEFYKQTKSFSPSGIMESGDRVPSRIFFDMRQKLGR